MDEPQPVNAVDTRPPTNIQPRNQDLAVAAPAEPNNQFGAVRDRLFHAMLVKVALSYSSYVGYFWRRLIEFCSLVFALTMLSGLLFVHLMFSRQPTPCLDHVRDTWPREGVLRVEVVENLKMLEYKERWIDWYKSQKSVQVCRFDPKQVLLHGPSAIPAEIRARGKSSPPLSLKPPHMGAYQEERGLLSHFMSFPMELFKGQETEIDEDYEGSLIEEAEIVLTDDHEDFLEDSAERAFQDHFRRMYTKEDDFRYIYRVEYSLIYGVLRLPVPFREKHNIETLWLRIDAEDACFGDALTLKAMQHTVGYEDAVMASLRNLAQNDTVVHSGLGYLHDLQTNEHFHFVSLMMSKMSYITAAFVMLIFTFAISMLLRFSHHQIFLFIVDLLHMFELNQPLAFPAAPLLTVILALVGMEAIMSEVFADTSTAFYVILIVWIADQYDAICCHSNISKRYWLRFFYLYQFFFYAYQYRFGGQYGHLALVASAAFIFHSMVFFFHHYEMPLILHEQRLQHIISEIGSGNNGDATQGVRVTPIGIERATITIRDRDEMPAAANGNTRSEPEPMLEDVQNVSQREEPPIADVIFQTANIVQVQQVDSSQGSSTVTVENSTLNAEERVAADVVQEAIDELFQM